jgi:hypothetical protein
MPDSFAATKFAPYPRRELRAHIMQLRQRTGSNMPDAAVDEIVDIACHAAESGRRAMLETLDRASDPRIANTAIGLASSLLASDLNFHNQAVKEFAKQSGLHFEEARLEVQADG